MVTVAMAGVAERLGLIILQAILATKKHTVIVLSRSPKPNLSAKGATVKIVDYTNHSSLTTALQGVHTVLSTVGGINGDVTRDTQLALLAAAKEAGVRRFAPSEYGVSSLEWLDAYAPKIPVWNAVKGSGLEYTRFSNGMFMNMLGTGTPKGEAEALEAMRPWNFVINMLAGTADIPGDGNAKATFTRTGDIGAFVAAALDLETWEEEMGMVGSIMSYNEIVQAIEKITGRKMLVRYNSEAELQKMIDDVPSSRFYNQARIGLAKGTGTVKPTLNEKFPDIKPWSVEQYLERFWGGVELPEPKWQEG